MTTFDQARTLLRQFKGDAYLFGTGMLPRVGGLAASQGQRAALVRGTFPTSDGFVATIRRSLDDAGVTLAGEIRGARPNAPREDVARIAGELRAIAPDVIVSFGGGSTIDAVKAAEVLRALGADAAHPGEIDGYFGSGRVSAALEETGRSLTPHVAIQSAASSSAHLTRYSNVTDLATGQKKLIVDDAVVPARAAFDYAVTYDAPPALTADGAMDGVAHSLEVLYGAAGRPHYGRVAEVAATGIGLIVGHLPRALEQPDDARAREALCLGTDLGGYAIMLGGTNGGHLTSFSLVDVLSHGRACAVMNPYYTVLFAPAIQEPLRLLAPIYREAGLAEAGVEALRGRDLGLALARAMLALNRRVGLPVRLGEVEGFGEGHVERALTAARNPQLRMKLENMPIPLTGEMVDDVMGSVLEAARRGEPELVNSLTA